MSIKNILLLIIFLLYISPPAYSEGNDFPILNIPFSSRILGMGGAFCGLADDVSSSYYNPAGLTNINGKEILAHKTRLQNEIDLYFISFGYGHKNNAFAIGWIQTNISNIPLIELTTASPTEDIHEDKQTNFQNHLLNFGYAHKFSEQISLGVSTYMAFGNFNNINNKKSKYFSLSSGLHYKINKFANLGILIKDLISTYKFNNSTSERALSRLILGINIKPSCQSNINFDLSLPFSKNVNQIHTYFGIEYNSPYYMDFRMGLYEKMPTLGISIKNNYMNISYTHLFSTNNFLGENNMVSLKINF